MAVLGNGDEAPDRGARRAGVQPAGLRGCLVARLTDATGLEKGGSTTTGSKNSSRSRAYDMPVAGHQGLASQDDAPTPSTPAAHDPGLPSSPKPAIAGGCPIMNRPSRRQPIRVRRPARFDDEWTGSIGRIVKDGVARASSRETILTRWPRCSPARSGALMLSPPLRHPAYTDRVVTHLSATSTRCAPTGGTK